MDADAQSRFDRLDSALNGLIDSLTLYNPSPAAAASLVAAEDHLAAGLDQLTSHQRNYLEIQSLRVVSESLDNRLKTTLLQLAEVRRELLTPSLSAELDAPHQIDHEQLLSYAQQIARFTVPPTYRPPLPPAIDGTTLAPTIGEDTHSVATPLPPSTYQAPGTAPNDDSVRTPGVSSPRLSAPPDPSHLMPSKRPEGKAMDALPLAVKAWLQPPSFNVPFMPWPEEDSIRRGALGLIEEAWNKGLGLGDQRISEDLSSMAENEELDVDLDLDKTKLLLAAAHHDIDSLQTLLRTVSPNVQDADTGYTALHTAIAASVETSPQEERIRTSSYTRTSSESDQLAGQAERTLKLLFQNGAIWNDLDNNGETPGCLAWRLGLRNLYEIVVDAGVRAELLLNRLDEYAPLSDTPNDDSEEETGYDSDPQDEQSEGIKDELIVLQEDQNLERQIGGDKSTLNENYLRSSLSFSADRLLDSSTNGVMMSWETDIMRQTAALLLPRPNLSILNIGHGMGIFDRIAQEHSVASHHIIEAHPDVLSKMRESGWMRSSDSSSHSGHKFKNVTVHAGRWQDILPRLQADNQVFDAIYFDTFAESYNAFREFFSEHVIGLLDMKGSWSFFHGLGADRQVCYDVYTKVAEIDMFEAGFDVIWEILNTPEIGAGDGQGEKGWDGVRRRYWNCDNYRLPICRFVG